MKRETNTFTYISKHMSYSVGNYFLNSGITVQRLRGQLRVVLFSSNVSCYLKSDKIGILFLDLVGNFETDREEGTGSPGPPRYFWTKLRPERKPVSYTHLTLPTKRIV